MNNDADENPYDINLAGIIGYPEIDVWEAPNGGSFDFGTCTIGDFKLQVFEIENLGFADLQLTGTPIVQIESEYGHAFHVEQQPNATIPPNNVSTFIIRFEPNSPGYNYATLIIWNNDSDENPYEIMLSGYAEMGPMRMQLVVDTPNGEEELSSGSSQKITWKGVESIKDVGIEYSIDNGSTYRPIMERTPNPGDYDWRVPFELSPSCLVRISDANGYPAVPAMVSYELRFKVSSPENTAGQGSHLKMHLGMPDMKTQGVWFADVSFFPDYLGGSERIIFNQVIAESWELEEFLNKWHHVRVQYEMNSYMGSIWLDGALLLKDVPLQVGFPLSLSAEISFSSDNDVRAEILIDDMELRILDSSALANSRGGAESMSLPIAKDNFEAYENIDRLIAGGWSVTQDVVSNDQELSVITARESVSGAQSLRLKSLDGYSLSVVKAFSLPDRVPFDVSDENFTIIEAKAAAVSDADGMKERGLRAGGLDSARMRDRLEKRRELMKMRTVGETGRRDDKETVEKTQNSAGSSADDKAGILSVNPNGTYYIYGYDGKLLAEYDGLGNCIRDYIYAGDQLFAEYRVQESRLYYYCSDQINSTRMITGETGTVVYSATYDPYGGIQKTWISTYSPALKFSGKERDSESGLDYFGARYYYTAYYRFLSVDPVRGNDAALKNPQLWNLYAYCRNSPVSYWDPFGREITYESPALQKFFESLAKRSKMIEDTLARYEGADNPDLSIESGHPGFDQGEEATGDFDPYDVDSDYSGNEAKLTPGKTKGDYLALGKHTLKGARIIINDNLPLNIEDERTIRAATHELGHAEHAATDIGDYLIMYEIKTDKKGRLLTHDQRPIERRADKYAHQALWWVKK